MITFSTKYDQDELERLRREVAELRDVEKRLRREIEERKHVEGSLRASETRFRTLVEQAPFSIIIYDKNGRILSGNPASRKLWRLSAEEYANLIANYNILNDEVLAKNGLLDEMKRAFAGEAVTIPPILYDLQDFQYQEPILNKIWLTTYVYPVKDDAGQVHEVVIMHEDVTERKKAEADLNQSEILHRTLVQTIPYGVQEVDVNGRTVYVNPAFCRAIGYAEEELIGQYIWEWLPGETEKRHLQETVRTIHEIHPIPDTYYTKVQAKDGRIIETQTDWDYRRAADGAITGTIAIITDISSRKVADARLQNYTERLQIVHEVAQAILSAQSPEAIAQAALLRIQQSIPFSRSSLVLFDHTANEGFILASLDQQPSQIQAGSRYPLSEFDIDEQLIKGKPVIRTQLSDDYPKLVKRLKAEGLSTYMSIPLIAQGQLMGVIYLAAKELIVYSDHYIETLREIAEFLAIAIQQARLHEQVQQYAIDLEQRVADRTRPLTAANERLRELDSLKTKFISDVTHELRTPITNLNLYLDLIERNPKRGDHYHSVLRSQTERLGKLVESTLDLSRLDIHRDEMQFLLESLNPLAKQAVHSQMANAQNKGLEIRFIPEPDLPRAMIAGEQLRQMLDNLLLNAIHYTPHGKIEVRTFTAEPSGQVAIQIQDPGMGMTPEDLQHCFEPFYRGELVGQLNIPGNGLGLAIVKGIVDLHNGRIEVESVVDEGTTFTVWLPRV